MAIEDTDDLPDLRKQTSDYVASAAKAVLGATPFAGSLLAELAGTIVPNQRIDRIVKYAEELERWLARLDQQFVWAKLTNENFTDLLEESMRHAARSLTGDRRKYIATLVATGISSENIEFVESKHFLRILGEINDVEVIILRSYLVATIGGDKTFRKKHENVLRVEPAYLGSSQEVLDRHALQESYKEHLTSLGLLQRQYETDIQTGQPKYDMTSHGQTKSGYMITPVGRLLLRHIGLANDDGLPIDGLDDAQAGLETRS